MNVEYNIVNYLDNHPFSTIKRIAEGIGEQRYKIIYAIARLLWKQRVELTDYTNSTKEGRHHPRYIVKPISRGGNHVKKLQ